MGCSRNLKILPFSRLELDDCGVKRRCAQPSALSLAVDHDREARQHDRKREHDREQKQARGGLPVDPHDHRDGGRDRLPPRAQHRRPVVASCNGLASPRSGIQGPRAIARDRGVRGGQHRLYGPTTPPCSGFVYGDISVIRTLSVLPGAELPLSASRSESGLFPELLTVRGDLSGSLDKAFPLARAKAGARRRSRTRGPPSSSIRPTRCDGIPEVISSKFSNITTVDRVGPAARPRGERAVLLDQLRMPRQQPALEPVPLLDRHRSRVERIIEPLLIRPTLTAIRTPAARSGSPPVAAAFRWRSPAPRASSPSPEVRARRRIAIQTVALA